MRTTYIILAVIVVVIALRMARAKQRPAAPRHHQPMIKHRGWRVFKSLTVASMKMYFRNRSAVFFTFFFPVVLVVVFGLLSKGSGDGSISVYLVNHSSTPLSQSYVKAVKQVTAFKITNSNEQTARDQLDKGKIDLEVVIPKQFGTLANGQPVPAQVQTYYNKGRPGNGQTAGLILSQIATGFNQKLSHAPTAYSVNSIGVTTNNLGYIDFVLPGILAMTIMQLGIFSVAFGFISFKTSGALRRIQAAPINAANFLVAQSVTRYIVGVFQIALLACLGVVFYGLHLIGNVFTLWLIVTLGIAVFLLMGFAVAGAAKDENQAAPLAQLLQLPQLFLSGIFFSRDAFPHWLKVVTDYFPLTYLSDAMRTLFNQGASIWSLRTDILGLVVWGIVAYIIANRVFSWE